MGRREDRIALQASWTVLEPRAAQTPITKKDLEDLVEIEEQERVNSTGVHGRVEDPFGAVPRSVIARLGT